MDDSDEQPMEEDADSAHRLAMVGGPLVEFMRATERNANLVCAIVVVSPLEFALENNDASTDSRIVSRVTFSTEPPGTPARGQSHHGHRAGMQALSESIVVRRDL